MLPLHKKANEPLWLIGYGALAEPFSSRCSRSFGDVSDMANEKIGRANEKKTSAPAIPLQTLFGGRAKGLQGPQPRSCAPSPRPARTAATMGTDKEAMVGPGKILRAMGYGKLIDTLLTKAV